MADSNQGHPRTGYDPRKDGARCDICPLGPNPEAQRVPDLLLGEDDVTPRRCWAPVRSQGIGRAVLMVGELPGRTEEDAGEPLDGQSGWLLNQTLDLVGSHRRDVAVSNVIACCGPGASGGGMERLRARMQAANKPIREENQRRKQENKKRRAENKARLKAGEEAQELLELLEEIPSPAECCRPRLLKDLSRSENVILMGTTALRAVLGGTDEGKGAVGVDGGLTVSTKRGAVGVVEVDVGGAGGGDGGQPQKKKLKYGVTYHPAHVARKAGWRKSQGRKPTQTERDYQGDMGRFFRFFTDRMDWVDAEVLFHPEYAASCRWLDEVIAAGDAVAEDAPQETWPEVFCDAETTGKHAMLARMRCVSVGRHREKRVVARCTCDIHWDDRLNEHRREWLLKDKRFKDGVCPSCGREVESCRDPGLDGHVDRGAAKFKTDFESLLLFTPFSARWLHTAEEWDGLKWRLERVMTHPKIIKVGHNYSGYDRLVLEDSPYRDYTQVDTDEVVTTSAGKKLVVGRWVKRASGNKLEDKGTWVSCTVFPVRDSLFDTRFWRPDGDKGLGDIGPALCDVGMFKEDHAGNKVALTKNLWELGVYCAGADVPVNGRIWKRLQAGAADHGAYKPWNPEVQGLLQEKTPYETDHRRRVTGLGMHRIGFYVDQPRVRLFMDVMERQGRVHLARFSEFASRYGMRIEGLAAEEKEEEEAEKEEELLAARGVEGDFATPEGDGYDGLNVRSNEQLCELFFDRIGLVKPDFLKDEEFRSKTGNRTVADPILRAFICDPRTPEDVKRAIAELRLAKRKLYKTRNDMLLPLTRPLASPRDGRPKGLLWPDGCIHPNTNTSSNEVWRFAVSEPNTGQIGSRKGGIVVDMRTLDKLFRDGDPQAIAWSRQAIHELMKVEKGEDGSPYRAYGYLKSVLRARPGHVLVGGDADQLHLRCIANLYKIPILLDAFLKGEDPHTRLAEALFKDAFRRSWGKEKFDPRKKPPKGTPAFQMREVAKTFRYAVIYWASVDTAFRVIIGAENELGALVNTDIGKRKRILPNGVVLPGVDEMYRDWLEAEPEWPTYFWAKEMYAHEKNGGRVKHPFSQVTSQDMDTADRSLIVNRATLLAETTYASIAERQMMAAFPFGGEGAVRDAEFGGLPGLKLGQYGVFNPALELTEGFCGQTHDWFCAAVKDGRGSRGDVSVVGKDGKTEMKDKWTLDMLGKANDALTVRIPGHEVVYSCEAGLSEYMHEV